MTKIKKAAVAGAFYPDNRQDILDQISSFERNSLRDYNVFPRAVIVPHAGYIYSGQLAVEGFQYLDKKLKNIFIFAPAHRVAVSDMAVPSYEVFETPVGDLDVNTQIVNELQELFECQIFDEAFSEEHSIEVQLPFILYFLGSVNIIPILVGGGDYKKVKNIIAHYWDDEENGFVISSDLSHFYPSEEAKKIDNLTAQMIEFNEVDNFHHQQACGAAGVCGLCDFARKNDFSLIRIDLKNSGEVTGDKKRVVGYGTWLLAECSRAKFIKEHFANTVIDICSRSIEAGLKNEKFNFDDEFVYLPRVLDSFGASFVTLEKDDNLRGCIGSIVAHQSLRDDLAQNAYNAAFSDPRFYPLTDEEFDDVEIAVSILSSPVKMKFSDEEELLNQIQPCRDGIIIKDGHYQAVYLPSVWEQLPEKRQFLNSLKQKAGMSPNHFSSTFEAYRFYTEYIK